ncbi:non-ribosomal peptide synthetase [Paenibacillus pabuli]|uniref:non-ribosomal peptide synthetase n=1 Tax=Paenibacillus pabuli TaxID=1472 RepID=UPI0007843AAA|nr:non-ribosomal peptide synthetase [Paenibacillus pabuli]MEC0128815.1 non-ribosomal peptide synthetase [Paenibacillus pabuli]
MKKSLLPRRTKEDNTPAAVIEEQSGKDIAVIGMSLKVPGADSLDQFWSNLCRGEDWVREAPKARTSEGRPKAARRGYLSEIDTFDEFFFRIPPKEAALMDPYQRLFLEIAWSAIEDAGYGGDRLKGSRTGVYVGSGHENEYKQMIASYNAELLSAAAVGNMSSAIASRISYLLDLRGPSLVIDTACSSSLIAVHLACQALLARECDMAIAGGIQLILDPQAEQPQIGIESPSSTVRAFDEGADGTVRGEGVGAILLKPLSRAIADNDSVYAVIKGSVSNQDGKSIGITSPNRAAQEQLLIRAWERAGIHPASLSYIETHGTGTPIGDPIEVRAIHNAFRTYTDKVQFCAIGSLKPNIGHLYHAAGIISFIKTALALHHEQLPPSIHFEKPNPQIDFAKSPVYVNAHLSDWKRSADVRRCGVSSFGMSGTNCHVVLEETRDRSVSLPVNAEYVPSLLTLSARTLTSLRSLIDKYRLFLLTADPLSFENICYTSNIGRGIYEYRLAVLALHSQELRGKLALLQHETFTGQYGELAEGIWFGGPEHVEPPNSSESAAATQSLESNMVWEKAASRYVRGQFIDWKGLHAGYSRRVVSVPTYAFDQHRHWAVPVMVAESSRVVFHKTEEKKEKLTMENRIIQDANNHPFTSVVQEIMSNISGYSPEDIGVNRSFMELGMDSILLVNAKHAIKNHFGVDIPMHLFFEKMSTVAEVGKYIASQSSYFPESSIQTGPTKLREEQDEALVQSANIHPYAATSGEETEQSNFLVTGTGLEGIVQKQLDLMSLQLSMLQRGSMRSEASAARLSAATSVHENTPLETEHHYTLGNSQREPSVLIKERQKPDRPYVPFQTLETHSKTGLHPLQERFIDEFISRYTTKTVQSQLHTQAFRKVVANNRNVAGYRPYWKDMVYQIVVDHAQGSTITDIDGNNYIDLTMGFGVNLFGHQVSFINEAVQEAVHKGMCVGPINAVAGQVASALHQLTGIERAAFFNSGTEAIMVAMRLARAATNRTKIVIFSGSYHGTYDGVLAMSAGLGGISTPIAPGILQGMVDDLIVLNYDHPESLRFIERHAGELAAVLVEPVQSRRPDIQPTAFLKELRSLTAVNGIALIFDEVITGFRIHPGGAQAWFGIAADMVVYGKVVGGGLPIGIVAGKERYLDGIDGGMWSFGDASFPPHEERRTFVAGTFCQHPLAMNAALAVLRRIQKEGPVLQEQLNKKTAVLADRLNHYFAEKQVPLEIVHFGSLFRFVQKSDLELLYYLLIEKGIYIWEGRNCFLSTAHTEEDIDRIVYAVQDSVEELRSAGFLPPSSPTSPGGGRMQPVETSAAEVADQAEIHPLTAEQTQLWFASQANDDINHAYVESVVLRLEGTVDIERLRGAIRHVVQKNGMLRTRFSNDEGLYYTEPFESVASKIIFYEAERLDVPKDLPDSIPQELTGGFDLSESPLIRFGLLHFGHQQYRFIMQAHHLAADGWSLIQILKQIAGYYTMHNRFQASDSVLFSAFAQWQRSLPLEEKQLAREFWTRRLSNPVPELVLPANLALEPVIPYPGMRLSRSLNAEFTEELRAFGKKKGVSLFMLMLAAYNVLLSQISGLRQITVGIPVAGQLQMGVPHLVGQCVNLLPFSSRLPDEAELSDYTAQVRDEMLELLEHQRCSYVDIVTALVMEGQPVYPPVISTIFNFDKAPAFEFEGLTAQLESVLPTVFKYPISMNVLELDQELILELDVGSEVCAQEEAESWLEIYTLSLAAVVYRVWKEGEAESSSRFSKIHTSLSTSSFVLSELHAVSRNSYRTDIPAECTPTTSNDPDQRFAPPVTEMQIKIHTIWLEIMKLGNVGIHDHFLTVGGNSLAATVITARLQEELGSKVPLSLLFRHPTIAELAQVLEAVPASDFIQIPKATSAEFYPQSTSQRSIFAVEKLGRAGTAYNVTGLIVVEGTLDLQRLELAANLLVQRHECLRTSFHLDEDEPVQRVASEAVMEIPIHLLDSDAAEETILSTIRPFDLEQAPLLRMEYWTEQKESGSQYLLMDMHHLIADGLSANLLFEELIRLYDGQSLPVVTRHMKDFTQWQLGRFGAGYMRESEKYWSQQFKEGIPRMDWGIHHQRPAVRSFEGERYGFQLPAETLARIKEYAAAEKVTLYSYFLAAYKVLLFKYSAQEHIMVGTTASGRQYSGIERIPGMFVNTIPLRSHLIGDQWFSKLIHEVQINAVEAFEHQEYPLDRLSALPNVERDSSWNPLLGAVYVYQHQALSIDPQIGGDARFTVSEYKNRIAKFDLTLEVVEGFDELHLDLEYSTAVFHPEAIKTMAGHLSTILEVVSNQPDVSISEISLLHASETRQLLHECNETNSQLLLDQPMFALFEEQVQRTPDAIAISCAGVQLTYLELNMRANRFAQVLKEQGVLREMAVGLVMKRSPDLLAAILGTWKAGAYYVPIDPSYPKDRIGYILTDCKAQWVITDAAYEEVSNFTGCLIMAEEVYSNAPLTSVNPERSAELDDLAYIIYTSGSTGKPKGVMVEHQGLTNYIRWADQTYVRGDRIRFPLYSSISFDLTVTSMFTPLLSGNQIIIYPEDVEFALERICEEDEVDIIKLTPSHLKLLSLYNTEGSSLKRFIVGGEAFESSAASDITSLFGPHVEIYNEYGPTETVVGCMIHKYDSDEKYSQVPIGWPIDNMRLYISDEKGNLQAKHLPGELCIAGIGVARGYANQPELTLEKFVSNWFQEPGRVYRTGDLVRWLPGGGMEYLGRIDEQVKIRGYRIELGEVRNLLLDYPSIREAALLVKETESGEKHLCAFYVSAAELETGELESYLSRYLPQYMLPAEYIPMDRLPLSANGKVDIKKLPVISAEPIQSKLPLQVDTPGEADLLQAWREILRAPDAARDDHFMRLGGDSIKAIQIAARMKKCGYRLEAADILRWKTVSSIAPLLIPMDEAMPHRASELLEGDVPLAPIQHWFFRQDFAQMNYWNNSVTLIGAARFNDELVRETFRLLTVHHHALRMTFKRDGNHIQQSCNNADRQAFAFHVAEEMDGMDVDKFKAITERMTEDMHQAMDMEHGPLVQVGLIRGRDRDELILIIHHLVIDAVSWRILLDDFYDIYFALKQDIRPVLPSSSDSYLDYVQKMRAYIAVGEWKHELRYWKKELTRQVSPLNGDGINLKGQVRDCAVASLHFTQKATKALMQSATERYEVETSSLLLAALGTAMEAVGIPDGLWVNMEGHGREGFGEAADYSRTVGWFTSHYPIYLDTSAAKTPDKYVVQLHRNLQRIPHRGAGFNVLKYMLAEEESRQLNAYEIEPQICFNYLGEMDDSRYQDLFRLSQLPMHGTESPDADRPFVITCNVLLSDGRMLIEFDYNKQQFSEEIIQRMLQAFLSGWETIMYAGERPVFTNIENEGFQLVPSADRAILQQTAPLPLLKAYPLSPMQESMLFYYLRFPDSTAYEEQCVIHLQGNVDPERLRYCFQQVVNRHDILRTFFALRELERPLQAVVKSWMLPFEFMDWTGENGGCESEKLEQYLQQNRDRRFNLFGEVPLRVALIRTDANSYCLVWNFHHILLDGWSVGLLLSNIFDLYAEPSATQSFVPAAQYCEYIQWLEQRDPSVAEAYWETYLAGYRSKSVLPRIKETSGQYNRDELTRNLPEALQHALLQLSAEYGLTLNILFQAAWAAVLQNLSEIEDILFGAVVSGRSVEVKEINSMIGLFINTIPVRIKSASVTFLQLASQLQSEQLEKEPYSHIPLSAIQKSGGGAVLDHILVFENYPLELKLPSGLEMADYDLQEYTSYDFNLIVEPHEGFLVRFVYNDVAYRAEEMADWMNCLFLVLNQISENPNVLLKELFPNEIATSPDEGESLIKFHF